MVPLSHDPEPDFLKDFKAEYQELTVDDFNSEEFHPIKVNVKSHLYSIQGNICVYCERKISDFSLLQIDHIKPKAGANAHPNLCFEYTNYAISCIQQQKHNVTCGQQKKSSLLEVEPTAPDCNTFFALNTDGVISPAPGYSRKKTNNLKDMNSRLGLNRPMLVNLRQKRIENVLKLLRTNPQLVSSFIMSGDFRHILTRLGS